MEAKVKDDLIIFEIFVSSAVKPRYNGPESNGNQPIMALKT